MENRNKTVYVHIFNVQIYCNSPLPHFEICLQMTHSHVTNAHKMFFFIFRLKVSLCALTNMQSI